LRERGATVVLISQRAGVMALVDKVMVLKAGTIDAFGTRDEILRTLRRANIAAVGARA
jgi:ABC-type protease/lipase transport system fused ATPase/permease subunit